MAIPRAAPATVAPDPSAFPAFEILAAPLEPEFDAIPEMRAFDGIPAPCRWQSRGVDVIAGQPAAPGHGAYDFGGFTPAVGVDPDAIAPAHRERDSALGMFTSALGMFTYATLSPLSPSVLAVLSDQSPTMHLGSF
jgi:hypothetical protein